MFSLNTYINLDVNDMQKINQVPAQITLYFSSFFNDTRAPSVTCVVPWKLSSSIV